MLRCHLQSEYYFVVNVKNGSGTGLKFQKKGWRIYGRYSERKVKSA